MSDHCLAEKQFLHQVFRSQAALRSSVWKVLVSALDAKVLEKSIEKSDRTMEDQYQEFLLQAQRWSIDVDAILGDLPADEKRNLEDSDWMQNVRTITTTVVSVVNGLGLANLAKASLTAATFESLLVIGGVTVAAVALGVLLHKLHGASLTSYLVQTKVMLEETFHYVKNRLVRLDRQIQRIGSMALPLRQEAAATEAVTVHLRRMVIEFCEAVRVCRLDIGESLGKLEELKPVVIKCIGQLEKSLGQGYSFPPAGWIVAGFYRLSVIFFGKGNCDFAVVKDKLVVFQTRNNSITSDLQRAKRRIDSDAQAVQQDVPYDMNI